MKMHLKVSSAKWQPFCPGGDELIHVSKMDPAAPACTANPRTNGEITYIKETSSMYGKI